MNCSLLPLRASRWVCTAGVGISAQEAGISIFLRPSMDRSTTFWFFSTTCGKRKGVMLALQEAC